MKPLSTPMLCDCGEPATIKRQGALICERCHELDKPHQTHKKQIGQREKPGMGNAHIDWEHYHLPKDHGVPIAGGSLIVLERMLTRRAA